MNEVIDRNIKRYCAHDSCPLNGRCWQCKEPITVERTFADEIKVVLPCGYSQRFWVNVSDWTAINKCIEMKKQDIK